MQKTEYLSDETIKQLNDYCARNRLSRLQLSYELKISYPTLSYALSKKRKATIKTISAINELLKNEEIIK